MVKYSVIGLIFYFIILLLGIKGRGQSTTVLDYFFGGRKLSFTLLAITFVASWWGAGSAISTADLAYNDGMGAFFYYGVPVLLSTFLIILMSKRIRKVGYLTQGKMMESRYNRTVSRMLSLMIVIYMVFNAAAQMVGIGDYFGSLLGMEYEVAILVGTSMVLVYSMFGGFKAVVITDVLQFIFLSLAAIIVFVVAMKNAGGMEGIRQVAEAKGKVEYTSLFYGVDKYIMYVITFGCSWMIQANVWQRISASRNIHDAKKMTTLSFFIYIPMYLMVVLTGMAGLALFDKFPEGGVMSAIVNNYMSPVLGAFVFVGISSAIMSTMDSLINTGAMTLVLDFPRKSPGKSSGKDSGKSPGKDSGKVPQNTPNISSARLATLFLTFVALLIALRIRSILEVSWIASDIITTGAFVPIVAGFFDRRGTSKGALASMIFGVLYCFYHLLVGLSDNRLFHLIEPGSIWQVIFGVCFSAILYFVVSRLDVPEFVKADAFISKS